MGMSTHVVGFMPRDETWEKMEAIWTSCEAAGVQVPSQVEEYFEYECPIGLPGREVDIGEAITTYSEDGQSGIDVDVSKIPPNVSVIRFFNSW